MHVMTSITALLLPASGAGDHPASGGGADHPPTRLLAGLALGLDSRLSMDGVK